MKKSNKGALVALAVAGLMAGTSLSCHSADKDSTHEASSEMSCSGKDGCSGTDGCAAKDGCASKDGCSGKDGCASQG